MPPDTVYVESDSLPWRESPFRGVRWKKLAFDPATGSSAVLLRFEAGARYGSHRHPQGEQYYVLDGSLEDGGRTWAAGSYVHHKPGSAHAPSSEAGCLLFVTLLAPIELIAETPGD